MKMNNREALSASIAQTLAPILFGLCATRPEEMGFPIYDTDDEVDAHLSQQFDPVGYWTAKAAEIAGQLVCAIEAGGVDVSAFNYENAKSALLAMRPDKAEHQG